MPSQQPVRRSLATSISRRNPPPDTDMGCPLERKKGIMSEDYKVLTREELNELAGEALPERAAMSLINANVAAPINAALALNVLSDSSVAVAEATQTADIDQST